MASNPLVPQGVLNKLRGSVAFILVPQLNVTAPFLGEDGITLAFEGDASGYLPTMTGAVPSPNPYQIVTASLHLLKTQGMSALWKARQETNTTIGDCVVTSDAATLPSYPLINCTIKGVNDLAFNGKSPEFLVTIQGTYYINAGLFNLQ